MPPGYQHREVESLGVPKDREWKEISQSAVQLPTASRDETKKAKREQKI